MRRFQPILGGIVLLILALYACTYQVRFSEVAIVKTFGRAEPTSVITQPGLRFRWPWPIQTVVTYDQRVRLLEDRTEETTTADGKNIIVTTYAGWKITDPFKFHTSFSTEEDAENRLRTEIKAEKKALVGQYNFSQFISTDAGERKLDEIERRMGEQVSATVKKNYGVEIAMFGIKRLSVPESVTQAIFESMKKAQESKAQNYVKEGEAQAAIIVSAANAKQERIMSAARAKAKSIESEAQAAIGKIYESYNEHPELRMFLDKLNALAETLRERTTIILDTTSPPVDLFDPEKRLLSPARQGAGLHEALDKASKPAQEGQ
ncbi:MAG TPA: protease modulator HflC [Phycisphaerae bacterium]